jgi:hypothetical protein
MQAGAGKSQKRVRFPGVEDKAGKRPQLRKMEQRGKLIAPGAPFPGYDGQP